MHPEIKSDSEVNIVESDKDEKSSSPDSFTTGPKSIQELNKWLEFQEAPVRAIFAPLKAEKSVLLKRRKKLSDEKTSLETDKTKATTPEEKQLIDDRLKIVNDAITKIDAELADIDGPQTDAAYTKANKLIEVEKLEQIPWQK